MASARTDHRTTDLTDLTDPTDPTDPTDVLFTGQDLATLYRVFRLNEYDDREMASDRVSRYGSYLRLNKAKFADDWTDDKAITTSAAEFTAAAWEVATGPIMSSPYLEWLPDRIRDIDTYFSEDDGSLIVRIEVAVPRPPELLALRGWREWDRSARYGYSGYFTPEDRMLKHGPAMLTSTLLLIRVPDQALTRPQADPDSPELPDTTTAKTAVWRLAEWLEEQLIDVLQALKAAEAGNG
ncbi:hypothetical protein GCM10009678_05030 [Actinomadura kijaniata]|uniref:Uncharacterized protein n=1 Tax=Actinomadura namibiensis TaxID=182080 RepID=A0A7W3LTB6_ACTNM|nr:hypothetical protein [Actinomadura namibiensis]MBA8953933.1 hypothetical protein [Actinomadura namibiensis]